jgi:D-glycero-D-manno-heptose 1,7-bisphosphate phosphatase
MSELSDISSIKPRRAVFLDRDGTVNVEKNYLVRPEDWEFVPGAIDAIKRINDLGFLAIVVTNQAGVARGFYTEADVARLHRHVDAMLAEAGARIDGYYMCPHHPDFGGECDCRKPNPGMLLQAAADFDIALENSYLIGDKAVDVQAALNANVTPILVRTGYGAAAQHEIPDHILCTADLSEAVSKIAELVA